MNAQKKRPAPMAKIGRQIVARFEIVEFFNRDKSSHQMNDYTPERA
jgi:hypothetical protein